MADLPKAIRDLILSLERLPGIGPKSASRLVFYLLNTPEAYVNDLAAAFLRIKKEVKICNQCFSVSEGEKCDICMDPKRDKNIICVVERPIDVMAIESVGGYQGVYHVLGGVLNPLEHTGPEELKITELLNRIKNGEATEIILAMNLTMEGEATALYINKKIEESGKTIKVSRIGSGLPMGADLEFADRGTLSRAMDGRRSI
jgi:recombination protein RecR